MEKKKIYIIIDYILRVVEIGATIFCVFLAYYLNNYDAIPNGDLDSTTVPSCTDVSITEPATQVPPKAYDGIPQKIIYYNTMLIDAVDGSNKVLLSDTKILYKGHNYIKYKKDDKDEFVMGNIHCDTGFVIHNKQTFYNKENGYVMLKLDGKYAKLTFDVGKLNESENKDVTLRVCLDDEYYDEFKLLAESPPIHLELDLNQAKKLKIEIVGDKNVKYGFINSTLYPQPAY